jgi:transcriptional regulator SbtR-like protein
MTPETPELKPSPTKRADAERNRAKIMTVARTAFADSDSDTEVSMAEISRRAVCEATETVGGETPGAALIAWLRRFFAFSTSKRHIAAGLLTHGDSSNPVFGESRARVLAAGRPLLVAAQHAHEVRHDLTLEQILDLIVAIARIHGAPSYREPILQTALDGFRLPTDADPT